MSFQVRFKANSKPWDLGHPSRRNLEVLQTHFNALPKAVQDVVNKLTQPIPDTEKEIAQKLKTQVTDLKSISIKKTQLQAKLDAIKSQYAAMLQDMQELQTKLTGGQQKLKTLSEQYMKAVNQSPMPEELTKTAETELPIPIAVETFVSSLLIDLTDDQRSQLHGLLKRPSIDEDERRKRRKKQRHRQYCHQEDNVGNTTPTFPGTTQGSWCPSPWTILMMIQTPHGFAVLLLAQHNGGGQMFVKVQGNSHKTHFFKHHMGTFQAQVKGRTPTSHPMFHKLPPTQVGKILTPSQALDRAWVDLCLGRQDQLSSRSRVERSQPVQTATASRPATGCSAPMRPRLNAFCRTSPG